MSDTHNAETVAPESADEASVMRCTAGPSRCMDDLCRNSHVGLCGFTDEDFADEDFADDE